MRSIVLLGVGLSALSTPALAQTGQIIDETPPAGAELPTSEPEGADVADDTGELAPSNEIVVSARRRTESVQDVPQTVNVVTSAQVEKLNLRNFTEISSVVPGLQMQSSGAFSNTATVRGIAFDPAVSGNNPSVEFYLNDAPISSAFLFQSTFDFGQFELQRGPQGTLRGRASPSGSIAVTTRRPDLDEVGAVFNGTITDLHARKVDGAFNIPIITDVLGVRVAGVIDNSRPRTRSLSEDINPAFTEGPYSRTKGIRASVRFEPVDWAQFNLMYQDLNAQSHTFAQLISESEINPAAAARTTTLIGAFDRRGTDEQGSFNRQDQKVFVGNADFQFAGQRLSYVGSWNKQDNGILAPSDVANFFSAPRVTIAQRTPSDPAGFDQVCQNEALTQGAVFTTGTYNQCTHTIAKRESHELRLASEERIAGIFDYVIGGFYDHNNVPSNLTVETPVFFSNPLTAVGPVTPGLINRTSILRRGTTTEKSVFGNLTAHFMNDRLELSGGLRYIDFKNRSLPTLQGPATGTALATSVPCAELTDLRCTALGQSANFDANATVYLASAKFKPTEDIMVYALTGSSWRPGPRIVGNFSSGPGGQGQTQRENFFTNLPPERSKSYEIGAKTSFLDGRGRFNISAFHQKFKNYPFFGPQVFFLNTNAGTGAVTVGTANNPGGFGFTSPVPVTVNGVEGELSFNITDRWSIGVNAAYSDGKIKNGTIACTDLNGDGIPDINATLPSVAQLQAAVGAGETLDICSGINRRASVSPKFSGNVQSEIGADLGENMDVFARGLYSFFGKTSANPDNPFDDVPFYGLLNLYAGIRDKDGAWELTLFGKNILKEREILGVAGSTTTTPYQIGGTGVTFSPGQYRTVNVTAPREFGVTAKIALGSR